MIRSLLPSTSVSSLVDFWFGDVMYDYELWCKSNGLNPDEITKKSQEIGHAVEKDTFDTHELFLAYDTDRTYYPASTHVGCVKSFNSFLEDCHGELLENCQDCRKVKRELIKAEQNIKYEEDGICLYHGRYDFSIGDKLYDMKTWGAWDDKPLQENKQLYSKIRKAKWQVYLYYRACGLTPHILYVAHDGYRVYELTDKDIETFDEMFDVTINMLKTLGKNYFTA